MSVESKHPEYTAKKKLWDRCRHSYDGEDAIKTGGEFYLPKLKGQTDSDYKKYKSRATFYGFMTNTVNGRSGSALVKPPTINYGSDELKKWSMDVNGFGLSLIKHMQETLEELLITGGFSIFPDMPEDGGEVFLIGRNSEQLTNWFTNEKNRLEWVVFEENIFGPKDDDKFTMESKTQYRELRMEEGKYAVVVWEKEGAGEYIPQEPIFPQKMGKPFEKIPVVTFGVESLSIQPSKPPLLDMVNLNISHYKNSADLEQLLHSLACGTPYMFGVDDENMPTEVGPDVLITNPNPDVKIGILEFSGSGAEAIQSMMEDKKAVMAELGAKISERQRKKIETAETARIRTNAENSLLDKIVDIIGIGYEQILRNVANWKNLPSEDISIEMSHDFINEEIKSDLLNAFVDAFNQGAISQRTLFHRLEELDVYPKGWTFEEEVGAIEENGGGGQMSFNSGVETSETDETIPQEIIEN